jgi:hypothetical protein
MSCRVILYIYANQYSALKESAFLILSSVPNFGWRLPEHNIDISPIVKRVLCESSSCVIPLPPSFKSAMFNNSANSNSGSLCIISPFQTSYQSACSYSEHQWRCALPTDASGSFVRRMPGVSGTVLVLSRVSLDAFQYPYFAFHIARSSLYDG